MSTIVICKEAEKLVFGTDSRFMHFLSGTHHDRFEKIIEICADTYISVTGPIPAVNFAVQRSRELAAEMNSTDITAIAERLDRELRPCLEQVVEDLRYLGSERGIEHSARAASGEKPLCGFALAGRNRHGKVGFTYKEFIVRDGQIACRTSREYFGVERHFFATSADGIHHLAKDPRMHLYPLIDVCEIALEAQRQANPHVGGPAQIVEITRNGSRWISRLEAPEMTADPQPACAHAVIDGATFEIRSNGITTKVKNESDGATHNGFACFTTSGSADPVMIRPGVLRMRATYPSGTELVNLSNGSSGLVINNSSGNDCIRLDRTFSGGGSLRLFNSSGDLKFACYSHTPSVQVGDSQVLTSRQTGPGNTTDVSDVATRFNNLLTALRVHGLID